MRGSRAPIGPVHCCCLTMPVVMCRAITHTVGVTRWIPQYPSPSLSRHNHSHRLGQGQPQSASPASATTPHVGELSVVAAARPALSKTLVCSYLVCSQAHAHTRQHAELSFSQWLISSYSLCLLASLVRWVMSLHMVIGSMVIRSMRTTCVRGGSVPSIFPCFPGAHVAFV